MLTLCPGRFLLHHKDIENDQTIFFHVTAGNVKFAVSQDQILIHSIFVRKATILRSRNFRYRLLYVGWKSFIRDSRILIDKKTSDFVLS